MSLSSILNIASSGLQTAQTGLRTVSDNVSNVDTPGYIRKVADQSAVSTGGQGAGVDIDSLKLAADKFLQAAGLQASADSGAAGARASSLDQAQALFGDPNSATSFFSELDGVFSGFSALSSDSTTATRATAVTAVQGFLDQASSISTGVTALQTQTDAKIADDVTTANGLLQQIDGLNADISRAAVTGKDATGSQNQQSSLIDQLSSLMDVKVTAASNGGVVVRASDGLPLAGDGGPATLSYDPTGAGRLLVTSGTGVQQPLGGRLTSGELKGLTDLRQTDLPGIQSQLAELVAKTADALNAAHNGSSAVPAPSSLTGRSTFLSSTEAFSGLTGQTTVDVVNAQGAVQRKVDVDFTAGTLSVNGAAATSFGGAANFVSALSTALGSSGSASFSADGALAISATGGNGVAVADSATSPTAKAGQAFSSFFGLNDLVTSSVPSDYATGLTNASAAGFTGSMTLRLTAADGSPIKDVTVNAGSATTMGGLVGSLNAATTGVGLYGSFALDDATGALAFTPAAGSGVQLSVVSDTTARGADGPSVSAMFGIGDAARAARAGSYAVRSDIAANPNNLALARLDTTAAAGATALYASDASGADALSQAGRATLSFDAAGGLPGGVQTVSNYASAVASTVANAAQGAANAQTSATAVASEATSRRSSVEGVNLDEELVSMTTYQQAYNASARMVQAVKDMYDTLLQMVN